MFFYITYENLIKTANNFLKNSVKIIKIIIIYDDFIEELTIPEKVINRFFKKYYKFKNVFNRFKINKLFFIANIIIELNLFLKEYFSIVIYILYLNINFKNLKIIL